MMTNSKNLKKGFTLLESLVAVTILTLSIAGPLYGASRAIVASGIARDQLTASYLAQEGIENMRARRDSIYLARFDVDDSDTLWLTFLTDVSACATSPYCQLDPLLSAPQIRACSGNCSQLYRQVNGIYTTQNTADSTITPFTRTIQIAPLSGQEERITSTVSWTYHGSPYSIEINDHFTSWQ